MQNKSTSHIITCLPAHSLAPWRIPSVSITVSLSGYSEPKWLGRMVSLYKRLRYSHVNNLTVLKSSTVWRIKHWELTVNCRNLYIPCCGLRVSFLSRHLSVKEKKKESGNHFTQLAIGFRKPDALNDALNSWGSLHSGLKWYEIDA